MLDFIIKLPVCTVNLHFLFFKICPPRMYYLNEFHIPFPCLASTTTIMLSWCQGIVTVILLLCNVLK